MSCKYKSYCQARWSVWQINLSHYLRTHKSTTLCLVILSPIHLQKHVYWDGSLFRFPWKAQPGDALGCSFPSQRQALRAVCILGQGSLKRVDGPWWRGWELGPESAGDAELHLRFFLLFSVMLLSPPAAVLLTSTCVSAGWLHPCAPSSADRMVEF